MAYDFKLENRTDVQQDVSEKDTVNRFEHFRAGLRDLMEQMW